MSNESEQHDVIDKTKFEIPISELNPREVIGISKDASLYDLVELLTREQQGSVCVIENNILIGIVSERDLFMNFDDDFDSYMMKKVEDIMTVKPFFKSLNDLASDCLTLMGLRRIRSIPIVNDKGEATHILTAHDMLKFIIKFFPRTVEDIGTLYEWKTLEVHVQDENFSFKQNEGQLSANFFFSPLRKAVTSDLFKVDQNEYIQDVITKMKDSRKGMVAITRYETELVGILTERDLLKKVFGKIDLNGQIKVSELMTPNPITLLEKHILSYAINNMFAKNFRNIILVDEEKTPISSISLIDLVKFIADKF